MILPILASLLAVPQNDPLPITVKVEDSRVLVQAGDETFSALYHGSKGMPYLYPVVGPDGVSLTRGYPMDPRPGETMDHPHHRSMWFAHGAVNGYDFWHSGPAGERIELREVVSTTSGEVGSITARYTWVAQGKPVLEEERTYRFSADPRARRIDMTTRLTPVNKPVTFGDTKEGTFAVRLTSTLRLTGPFAEGSARNSKGDRERKVWGKRASWMAYHGPAPVVDGPTYTVALFDHPNNLRHPTWWHARDYGLVGANPFGIHDFEGTEDGSGDHTVAVGETLELQYRVLLRKGQATDAQLDLEGLSFRNQGGVQAPVPESYRLVVDETFETPEVGEDGIEHSILEDFALSDPEAWEHQPGDGGSMALIKSSDYTPPHRSPHSIALLREPLFGSFVMEAEVQQTGREYGHRDLCFFFGFSAPDRYYYAHVATTPDAHAHNVFLVSGAPREALAKVPEEGVDWGTGWHKVRITRDLADGTIRVDYDGQTVLETRDSTHAVGRIGFGSFDDTGRIRHLRVWADEVKQAPAEADPFRR